MEHQLESSKTVNLLAFLTQRISQWGYIPAFGTPTTGRREAVSLRPIGAKRLSPLRTEASTPIRPAFGLLVPLLVAQTQALCCYRKNWTPQAKRGLNGFRRITWFTIIARTLRGSHKASLKNALHLRLAFVNQFVYSHMHMLTFLFVFVFFFLFYLAKEGYVTVLCVLILQ